MITLSDQEREKLVMWLNQESLSFKGMVEQMEKVGMLEAVIKRERTLMAAYKIVADHINSFETMSI